MWLCSMIQSARAPENLTTFPHFSVSSAIRFPKSTGDPPSTVSPRSVIRALISRSASTALIALLSLSMISAGEFLGAPMPYQDYRTGRPELPYIQRRMRSSSPTAMTTGA